MSVKYGKVDVSAQKSWYPSKSKGDEMIIEVKDLVVGDHINANSKDWEVVGVSTYKDVIGKFVKIQLKELVTGVERDFSIDPDITVLKLN
jgi:translation elongation factor P/translation initiation factor 5A